MTRIHFGPLGHCPRGRVLLGGAALALVLGLGAALLSAPAPEAGAAPGGWRLPATARKVAPGVYKIGTRKLDGRRLQGYAILTRSLAARPGGMPAPAKGKKSSDCFSYIARGAAWATYEPYRVDATRTAATWDASLTDQDIRDVVAAAIDRWEDAANGAVGDGLFVDVFDAEEAGTVARSSVGVVPNDVNEVMIAPIDEPGVIAVTFVWGVFGGPLKNRVIAEWDQIYNDDGGWVWGDVVQSGVTTQMDFDNIVTHEMGHSFGLGHPSETCTEETMYAYASVGETKKRTLHTGDIAGIDGLY